MPRDRPLEVDTSPVSADYGGIVMVYEYRKEILNELIKHGVCPKPTTPPDLIMSHLNDLYRYEIRRLRKRLVRREFPKGEYADRVVALRKRYPLVSIPTNHWTK